MLPASFKKAIDEENLPIITKYLKDNPDFRWIARDVLDRDLSTIHYASGHGKLAVIKLLIEKHPCLIDAADMQNNTPLTFAAAQGHLQVVSFLVENKATITPVTFNPSAYFDGYLPIHFAARFQHLEVFSYLQSIIIKEKIDICAIPGAIQQHLIHLSARFGWAGVVEYLLKQDSTLVDLKNKDNKTALALAMDNAHYETVVTILRYQGNESIIPLVTLAYQAVSLMVLQEDLAVFLGENESIRRILGAGGPTKQVAKEVGEAQNYYTYKSRGRRPSFYAEIDKKNHSVSIYRPVKTLGEGNYGNVRLFCDANGKKIAVKTPTGKNLAYEDLEQEAAFNDLACPSHEDKSSIVFKLRSDKPMFRYVMPFVEGEIAEVSLKQAIYPLTMVKMILAIVKELERIHLLGIIHNDIHLRNILIQNIKGNYHVRFIDFGLSAKANSLTRQMKKTAGFAPELSAGSSTLMALPNQDIYRLAYVLKFILKQSKNYLLIKDQYPFITDFLTFAQNICPEQRPTLASFIMQLERAIAAEMVAAEDLTDASHVCFSP